jgi:nitrogen fixation protein FixH
MTRRFTGWHMTAILVAFFAVVVAVNLVMARYAIGTFGGTVVNNSYVASQKYNRWLAEADKQARLGWTPTVALDPARRVVLSASKDGEQVSNLTANGLAIHPLGRAPSIALTFEQSTNGELRSAKALPLGRWRVRITLRQGSDAYKLNRPVQ